MSKKKVLLVDFNNLLFRSLFAHQGLTHKGEFTGGLFGAIDMISSAVNRYGIDRIMICHDKKPYHRSTFYKAYKADRDKTKAEWDDDRWKQVATTTRQMREWLKEFRFPEAEKKGYEADDFIGFYARYHPSTRYGPIFVLSNDSDFYQLLRPAVFLCTRNGLYGRKDFLQEFPDITPKQWPRVLALMGSHNGVPGIKGVGIKTAYKAVRDGMTDREVFKKWRVRRSDIEKRTNLATLPLPLVSDPPMPKLNRIKYDAALFEEFLDRFGIRFKDEFHSAMMRLAT